MIAKPSSHDLLERNPIALKNVLEALFRHKKKSLFIFLTIVSLTLLFLTQRDRSYKSTAKLFVRVGGGTSALDPTATASGQLISLTDTQDREIQSILDMLSSRGLVEAVVEKLGVERILHPNSDSSSKPSSPIFDWVDTRVSQLKDFAASWNTIDTVSDREKGVKEIRDSLLIEAKKKSSIISIECEGPSPEAARERVQAVLDVFQQQHSGATRTSGSEKFFQNQVTRHEAQLHQAMEQLRNAKSDANLVSIEGKRSILDNQLQTVEGALLNTKSELASANAKIQLLKEQLKQENERIITQKVTGVPNIAKDNMREQLFALQIRAADIKSRYAEDSPQVVTVMEQLHQAKEALKKVDEVPQETVDVNETYKQLKLALYLESGRQKSLLAQLAEQQAQHKQVLAKLRSLNTAEVSIRDLERSVSILEGLYKKNVQDLEDTRVIGALELSQISNIDVYESPTYVERPADINSTLALLFGTFVAFCAAIGTAIGFDMFSDRVHSSEDAEFTLGVPVLATFRKQKMPKVHIKKVDTKADLAVRGK